MEKPCNAKNPVKHGISQIYKILTELGGHGTLPSIEKWEQDMGLKLDETQISAVYNYASDITLIEANYKCMVRWHLTPERINKIQPNKSPQCWRNCKQGTTLHIWWDCLEIKEYWRGILEHTEIITGERIPQHPWNCLFHGTTKTRKQYKKRWFCSCSTQQKVLSLKKWLCTKKPSIKKWLQRVDHINNMEYLCSAEQGRIENYRATWVKWRMFKTSEKYSQSIIEIG